MGSPVRKSHTSVVLAAVLLTGLAGCQGDDRASASPSPALSTSPAASAPVSPSIPAPAASTSAPASSAPAPSATGKPPAPSDKAFPFAVTRRGGFAGVDDHATIAADGSAVITRQGKPAVRTSLPAGTMAELGRLLTTPELTGKATPTGGAVCNDGFEYELVSPSSTTLVVDCGAPHGTTVDRILDITAGLFDN